MTLPVYIRPRARQNVDDACAWLERARTGFGRAFLESFTAHVAKICDHPFAFPVAFKDVRYAYMKRFRHKIAFRVAEDTVVICTVVHASRNPKTWRRQIRRDDQ